MEAASVYSSCGDIVTLNYTAPLLLLPPKRNTFLPYQNVGPLWRRQRKVGRVLFCARPKKVNTIEIHLKPKEIPKPKPKPKPKSEWWLYDVIKTGVALVLTVVVFNVMDALDGGEKPAIYKTLSFYEQVEPQVPGYETISISEDCEGPHLKLINHDDQEDPNNKLAKTATINLISCTCDGPDVCKLKLITRNSGEELAEQPNKEVRVYETISISKDCKLKHISRTCDCSKCVNFGRGLDMLAFCMFFTLHFMSIFAFWDIYQEHREKNRDEETGQETA